MRPLNQPKSSQCNSGASPWDVRDGRLTGRLLTWCNPRALDGSALDFIP